MITISICIIVKDEEKVLSRALNSVKDIADEIIIVDTGSKDKTKDIAKNFTNKLYDFKWEYDFSKARNYSFSKATKDYIMWLDADDVILSEDLEKIKELKKNLNTQYDILMFKYNTGFDENGNVNFSYYRERLLKREKNYIWKSPIHEVIELHGKILYTDIAITHRKEKNEYSNRNLLIFEKMIKEGTTLDARQQFYYARELYYNKKYKKSIKNFNIFLNDKEGWIENKINACIDLSNCYFELNDLENGFISLTRSFLYDKPRAEVCCKIGEFFMLNKQYLKAIFWYKTASDCLLDLSRGGFYNIDCYNFIPYIELCVCYYKIGDLENSKKYNELAGKIKPTNSIYLSNKAFFESL